MATNRAEWPYSSSRVVRAIVSILFLSFSVDAVATNNCPWMNEATASGLLGGNSTNSYAASPQSQTASCAFTNQTADGIRALKIVVTNFVNDPHASFTKWEAACESEQVPLRAIGNEAVACILNEDSVSKEARAMGRVRNQVFEIVFTTSLPDDPILTEDALKTRIKAAAEQVSGNLF